MPFARRRPRVKVHGLLRTGTNYMAALLHENFRLSVLDVDEGGWKHGPIQRATGTSCVVTFKSPYTWLESFYEWERIHNRTDAPTLLDFARAPITHPRLVEAWAPEDPVDAWNRSTAAWLLAAEDHQVLVVRYEDLLGDLERELARFEEFCPAHRRHRVGVDIPGRVDTWPTPRPRRPLNRDRYRSGIPSVLEPAVRDLLIDRLDHSLLSKLGYGGPA